MGLFNSKYPYTNFTEMNLDYILDMCRKCLGIHLEVVGDKLTLKNELGELISDVTISFATEATEAEHAGTADLATDATTAQTALRANKATGDKNGVDITDYVRGVSVSGIKVRITHGDGTIEDLTVPYATEALSATQDSLGNDITTYAVALSAEANKVCLRDRQGRLLSEVTVPYATEAGHSASADSATNATNATNAQTAVNATNAIQSVTIEGDTIKFTTYGGQSLTLTVPYAVKAQKDELGNVIKSTYVANVTESNGVFSFLDAQGNTIVTLTPTVDSALKDSLGNTLYDYIKTIAVSSNSNYVTVTHGDGNTDSITIHYSETAWKDTNGNVIKNTYIKNLAIVTSSGTDYLVAYNGDTPQAELFRIALPIPTLPHTKAYLTYLTDYMGGDDWSWNASNLTYDSIKDENGVAVDGLNTALAEGLDIYLVIKSNATTEGHVDYGKKHVFKLSDAQQLNNLGDTAFYFSAILPTAYTPTPSKFMNRCIAVSSYEDTLSSVNVWSQLISPIAMRDLSDVEYSGARPAESDLLRYTRTGGNVWKNSAT